MKILFISSGNKKNGISPIVKKQGESLKKLGIEVIFYTIKGKGLLGYLGSIPNLRKFIKKNNPSLIHAHYSFCGIISTLSFPRKKLIVSLMGTDAAAKGLSKVLIRLFYRFSWNRCIVKSQEMKQQLGFKNILVLPNGVDFEMFNPYCQASAIKDLGWQTNFKHVLFAANPDRPEKNFDIANAAFEELRKEYTNVKLHVLKDVPHWRIPLMMNAADVVLLTSLREGSPNVIKEAMGCCRPIVATKVGDIKEVIGETNNCFVVEANAAEIFQAISSIFSNPIPQTDGRNFILHLSEDKIAARLVNEYQQLINGKK